MVDDPAQARRLRRAASPASTRPPSPPSAPDDVEPAASPIRASSATGPRSPPPIGNARAWLELDDPVAFLWDFVDGAPVQNRWSRLGEVPATTPASEAMSKALKRRGFRFVGPTICYALMQACGLVNDHLTSCFRHAECAQLA